MILVIFSGKISNICQLGHILRLLFRFSLIFACFLCFVIWFIIWRNKHLRYFCFLIPNNVPKSITIIRMIWSIIIKKRDGNFYILRSHSNNYPKILRSGFSLWLCRGKMLLWNKKWVNCILFRVFLLATVKTTIDPNALLVPQQTWVTAIVTVISKSKPIQNIPKSKLECS